MPCSLPLVPTRVTSFMSRSESRRAKLLIAGPPFAYLLVFFALPTLIMVIAAFRLPGEFVGLAPLFGQGEAGMEINLTLENFERLATDWIYTGLMLKSLAYAGVTTLFCLIMAYPLALMIARSARKYRDLLILLVILPFWSNFLIRVYAWMIILGSQSYLTRAFNSILAALGIGQISLLFSPVAVVIGLVYVHLPFMILPLYANLEKHDPALLDAAQDLGANAWQRFWRVTFPLSMPGVYAGGALVFIPALGIFAIPDILGGTNGIMIGNLIKQQFLDSRDWPFGSALSIYLVLAAFALSGLAALLARGQRVAYA